MRPRSRIGAVVAAVVAVGSLIAFLAVVLGSSVAGSTFFGAGDLIVTQAPWAEDHVSAGVVNRCVSDTVDAAIPAILESNRRMDSGDFPLWQADSGAGAPAMSDFSQGLLSPIVIVASLFPEGSITAWIKLLETLVIAAGMVLWIRRIGGSFAAGIVGSLAFTTSSFMVMWTNWPQTRTAAFFPLLFWALERILQERTIRSAIPFPFVLASMILGGFPAIAVHAVYAGAAYTIVRLAVLARRPDADPRMTRTNLWIRTPLLILAGGAAAAVMISPFVVPWLESIASTDLTYRSEQWRAVLDPALYTTIIFPVGMGACSTELFTWSETNPTEGVSFVGAATLTLAVAAMVLRGRESARGVRWVMIAIVAITLTASFLGGGFNALLAELPLVGDNVLHRLRAIGGLAFAALAALGYDAVTSPGPGVPRRLWLGALVVPLFAAVALQTVRLQRIAEAPLEWWEAIKGSLIMTLVVVAIIAVLWLLVMAFGGLAKQVFAVVVPILVVVEGLAYVSWFWPTVPAEYAYPETRTTAYLQENLGPDRFAGVKSAYWHGAGKVDDLRSFEGHAFIPEDFRELLRAVDDEMFGSPTWYSLSSIDEAESGILDRLAVRYVVADLPEKPPGEVVGGRQHDVTVPLGSEWVFTVVADPGRMRAAVLDLEPGDRDTGSEFEVEIRDGEGGVVASSSRRLRDSDQTRVYIPVAGEIAEDLDGPVTVAVRLVGGDDLLAVASDQGDPWIGAVVAATDDSLRLVEVSDSQIYRRTTALPRIRWGSQVIECAGIQSCATGMESSRASGPGDTRVHLDRTLTEDLALDRGSSAVIDVVLDSDDEMKVAVMADGDGLLVVADVLRDGWSATVDGSATDLVPVDGVLMGVPVTEGRHTVVLEYLPTGWPQLPWLAGLTAMGLGILAAAAARPRRRDSVPDLDMSSERG